MDPVQPAVMMAAARKTATEREKNTLRDILDQDTVCREKIMNLALTAKKMAGTGESCLLPEPQASWDIRGHLLIMLNKKIPDNTRGVIPLFLILILLGIPAVSAAGAAGPGTAMTVVELNVTNATVPDPAALADYRITPEPVRVQAELTETQLPASKGEMASGPRTIGFSVDPVMTLAIIAIIAVIGAGILYYLRRERDTDEQE